jgi:ubiquitin-activating enzyme E1
MYTQLLNNSQYDENRYSRQSYSIGRDSSKKISTSKILVIGYDILSEEIIKNMALLGCGEIDIYYQDSENNENLFFNIENKKIPIEKLRKLNPNTNIKIVNIKDKCEYLNIEVFNNYSLIVIVNSSINDAILINNITRSCEKPLIITGACGLSGYMYNDFGENFEIEDQDGEIYENLIPEEIIENTIKFKNKHMLNQGDIIKITYLNNITDEQKIYDIINPFTIKLDERISLISNINEYSLIIKKKIKKTIKNTTFNEFITNKKIDKIIMSDFSKPFERGELLLNLQLALDNYFIKFNELPRSWSQVDFEIFINILKEINENIVTEKNYNFILKYCCTSNGSCKPVASIIGGIVSHEIIKGITKKCMPIDQALFMDFIDDLIFDNDISKNMSNCNVEKKSKYSSLTNIFGGKFVNKLQSIVPFVIGSGAIGCEILKNLCCLGIKNIKITDNDNIEKSNLSRQLLFNDDDIGKSKSFCAGNAVMNTNSDCNVNIYNNKVESKTEHIFNKEFHSNVDIYMNALDNIDARKYMDNTAIKYEKPLLDSGTTGAQGSLTVIIPHLTESYQSSKNDASEEEIPLCTLKSFPFKPQHTIQWGRELFEDTFNIVPSIINKYIENEYEKLNKETDIKLLEIYKLLYKFKDFKLNEETLLIQSRILFNDNFVKSVQNIINENKNKLENTNKMPIMLNDDSYEQNFISSTFEMYNQIFNTTLIYNREELQCINYDNYEVKNIENLKRLELQNEIYKILEQFKIYKINCIEFEKDDDSLHHVQWITCCANIRNYQYSIGQIDEYETKKIAGKIIPALITTTAVISGYQVIEMIKIIKLYYDKKYLSNKDDKDIEIYKNRYINLNLNYHIGNDPTKCIKYYLNEEEKIDENNNYLTLWTRFICESNNTKEILKEISLKTMGHLNVYLLTDNTNKFLVDDGNILIEETNSEYCTVLFDEHDIEFYTIIESNMKK